MNAEQILTGLIITLILGSYGYTFLSWRELRKDIKALWVRLNNHYEHRFRDIERRLNLMDERHRRDHGPES